jgi:hypothetical protein
MIGFCRKPVDIRSRDERGSDRHRLWHFIQTVLVVLRSGSSAGLRACDQPHDKADEWQEKN